MTKRTKTKVVRVGDVYIGGNHPITKQSMTTTITKNIKATVRQINELATSGAHIVRLAVLDEEDAHAIKEIKKQVNVPIVADIHFSYQLALICANNGIDKIRINPGNIGSEDNVKKVVDACKKQNIPIRIGVNAGSLEKDILEKYGLSPQALVESAKRHVEMLEKFDFHNIVLSLKASHVDLAIEAYRLAAQTFDYPLHLGITEAGSAFAGTIKSAAGLGILLYEGIGNTIRISLSANPVEEVRVAKELLATFNLYQKPNLISCPTCGRIQYDMLPLVNKVEKYLENKDYNLTIAIMGCAVNGPGEAKSADLGIAGGKHEGLLFVKGKIKKKIPTSSMYDVLINEIEQMQKTKRED